MAKTKIIEWDDTDYTERPAPSGESYWEAGEIPEELTRKHVWTVVDGDDGDLWVLAGVHLVNRVGFLITEEEWTSEQEEYPLGLDTSELGE